MMTSGRRYLFILMGALGDVVRGMYLVDALKSVQADAHVTWLVEPSFAGILKLHPLIDEILVF
jgi:heptosyltransferase-1